MNNFARVYSDWAADRRSLSEREERGEAVGDGWSGSDAAAVELLHQAALLIGGGEPEVEYVWRTRIPGEPQGWIIPRTGDEYDHDSAVTHVFASPSEALEWFYDEVDLAVGNDEAEMLQDLATWVLCKVTTEALTDEEHERAREARTEATFLSIGYVRGADHVWRPSEAT